jgi:hypothetical protein
MVEHRWRQWPIINSAEHVPGLLDFFVRVELDLAALFGFRSTNTPPPLNATTGEPRQWQRPGGRHGASWARGSRSGGPSRIPSRSSQAAAAARPCATGR